MNDGSNQPASGRPALDPGVSVIGEPVSKQAGVGGAYEAASRIGRELATWKPPITSADGSMSASDKIVLDARGRDMQRNSGQMQGASTVHKDSIVGSHYRLNSRPNIVVLKAQDKRLDDVWAEEFQQEVEALFTLYAESDRNWIDAQRTNTFTGLIRLAIGCFFAGGEVLGQIKYIERGGRPFSTCLHMLDADRLSNPNDAMDTMTLRRGIQKDRNGAPIAAFIREAHPRDTTPGASLYKWERVKFWTDFGRPNILHIIDQQRPEQTRGVAEMVAALTEARMGKKFNQISLQNAIVQATYAATIESELPSNMAFQMIGANELDDGAASFTQEAVNYLSAISEYARGGRNIEIDGVKIPHLFPNSKLQMRPAGSPGGVGQAFEESLHRHVSAALGISYEEFTNDFTKTNYSSFRGASNKTARAMRSKKRMVADRAAGSVFGAWLEEAIVNNRLSTMPANAPSFYEGMNREAYCQASWIGASQGQVDELKETQAALLRINAGVSTWEIECARLGNDFREVFAQKARETKLMKALGIEPQMGASKPGTLSQSRNAKSGQQEEETEEEAAYRTGVVDCDGVDADGNKPFDDGFGD